MVNALGPGSSISIIVADDHTVMRNGLRMLLAAEPDFEVVAEAGTIQAVFVAVRSHRPTVLVLDLNMPAGRAWLRSRGSRRSRPERPWSC